MADDTNDIGGFASSSSSSADSGPKDPAREQLRLLLAALGIDLPVTTGDLKAASDQMIALQAQLNQATLQITQNKPASADSFEGMAQYGTAEQLSGIHDLQDKLAQAGTLFSSYAKDYLGAQAQAEHDKNAKTFATAEAQYNDEQNQLKDLKSKLIGAGDSKGASVTDYDIAINVAVHDGDESTAEKLREEKRRLLEQPAPGKEYSQYSDAQNEKNARLKATGSTYDPNASTATTKETQTTYQYGGPGAVGPAGMAAMNAKAKAAAQAQTALNGTAEQLQHVAQSVDGLGDLLQPAMPSVARLPSGQEFVSDFGNAFDTALQQQMDLAGNGLGPNEAAFARSVLKPQLMSEYTARLGEIAASGQSPYHLVSQSQTGEGGAGIASASRQAFAAQQNQIREQIRSSGSAGGYEFVALPKVMPLDFLSAAMNPARIKMLYEGSQKGAGQFQSSGTGTTIAREV